MRVEHEYRRCGAWAYIAALDVRRAKIFGRCERKTGIVPFDRLVAQVMSQPPYSEARRVFWIMDNGSSHRGAACVKRLVEKYPRIVPSWSHPRQLAQPDRDLLLYPSTESFDTQRLPVPGSDQGAPLCLRAALRGDRETVRVEIHAARSFKTPRQNEFCSRWIACGSMKNTLPYL